MQHRPAAWVLLAALIISSSAIWARTPLPTDVAARMDAYLTARTALGGFSGAVLVVQDGKTLLRKGYGYADVATRRPYTPDTLHSVASVSKMFTAMAVLKLRDADKLKLDDPICMYLEDCPATWQAITVQELMHHTSGIPDYEARLDLGSPAYESFMVRSQATAELYAEAKTEPLDFPPGSKFNYSNTGYIVLAHVVQAAAGEPFAAYVSRTLLKPAGMDHSGVLGSRERPAGLDVGYTFGDVGWDKLLGGFALTDGTLKPLPDLALTPPAGDTWLYSSVDDLYRWSRIMDGSKLVPAAEAQEVFTPGLEGYGYGWDIDTENGAREFQHTGSLPGLTTDFVKLPDSKLTLIVFCNLDRARMESIRSTLISILQGRPYDMPVHGKPVKLSDADYARLMGNYRMADGTPLTISREDAMLVAKLKGHYQAGLIPLSTTEFYFPLDDGEAKFTLDARGKATGVDIHYHGVDHPAAREN